MKKLLIVVVLFVGLCSFAKFTLEEIAKNVIETLANDESGTSYGVVNETESIITVSTPLGNFDVEKSGKNEYKLFGVKVSTKSNKNGKYTINSSIGNYEIDLNKGKLIKK